ncbi:hypothetical protein [Neorhizobium sp. NCHU2750]|uniref:hypothetical protein n=1 Tax=Neorhizobium sp. NCHU2750 TaxID=1825976 RepID=UPI000E734C67|nr:hypothetical protein NCHU2750_23430 [Neorhizobium sp. NCHU2750]
MTTFLEYSAGYEVKENAAVAAFMAALQRQQKAFSTGQTNRRSWVKQEVNGYYVKLGKLEKSYLLSTEEDVKDFLHRAAIGAQSEPDFQKLIEAAYGEPVVEVKRGRKKKAA